MNYFQRNKFDTGAWAIHVCDFCNQCECPMLRSKWIFRGIIDSYGEHSDVPNIYRNPSIRNEQFHVRILLSHLFGASTQSRRINLSIQIQMKCDSGHPMHAVRILNCGKRFWCPSLRPLHGLLRPPSSRLKGRKINLLLIFGIVGKFISDVPGST